MLPPLTQEQYDMIVADLTVVLSDSKDFFPADFGGANGGSYLGLFTRLAWHCAGAYPIFSIQLASEPAEDACESFQMETVT